MVARTLLRVAVVWMGLPASLASGQAIAGRVVDASGAPAPGVVVAVSGPSMIAPSRSVETDDRGLYRIEDIGPGSFVVRFESPGRQPYEVSGVEVTGTLTAVVDARLQLEPVAVTVTVEADRVVVDASSATREVTLTGDAMRAVPTARTYNALLPLVPGIVTSGDNVVTATASVSFPAQGGRTTEGRLTLDGFTIGSPPSGNSGTSYVVDVGRTVETTVTKTAVTGEAETSGPIVALVTDAGGNRVRGSVFAGGSGDSLQSDNLTDALRAQGVMAPQLFSTLYDVSATLGGPIARDRLWYFVNGHLGSSTIDSATVYYNRSAGDASAWRYEPELDRRAYSDRTFENASGRVTWQVAPRHRLSGFWDAQSLCRRCTGATPGLAEPQSISPEAVGVLGRRLDVAQATWWSPITDRVMLDAGFSSTYFGVGNFERDPNPTRGLIRVVEQCARGCAANGNIPGLVYRSQDFSVAHTGSYMWKASVTRVTGAHTLKAGYQQTLMTDDRTWMTNDQNLTYTFNNGVPSRLTQSISPWVNDARMGWQALFIQDRWTRERLTLEGAIRFDRARSWFPEQQEGPSRFLAEPIVVPETTGVSGFKDLTVRAGVAYDVFGDGRTVARASAGRYLEAAGVTGVYANTNPTLRMPRSTPAFGTAGVSRAWIDANGNFVPDCDLANPAAQDLRGQGADLCGAMSDSRFGQNVLTNAFDPAVLGGWGVRPSDWHVSASVQRQIGSRSWVAVAYTRRWFDGFLAVDNRALAPEDLTPYSVVAPLDPRLPGGGGYTIAGLYDVVPGKFGQIDNDVTDAARYGAWRQYFDGLEATASVRAGSRLTFTGGASTGRTVADACAVRERLPELSTTTSGTSTFGAGLESSAVTPSSPYCRVEYGLRTQARGLLTYTVPRVEVQVSAVATSNPGPMLAANYAVPNADVAPSLGRSLAGNASEVTVNLVAPGTLYGARINRLDLRASRAFRLGSLRTTIGVDVYNTFNASTVLTYNNAFVPGGSWLQPLSVLSPRFVKLTAEIDF